MATITGMTAAAMQAIRNGTVVSAAFDSANHLILTKYDGTQIDCGPVNSASTTVAGIVELATSAETQTGTDTQRAVTPAGLASLGYPVKIVTGISESASPASWPYGVALQSISASDAWSLNSSVGTVRTDSISSTNTYQTFYALGGGTNSARSWTRSYHTSNGGGGWTAWRENSLLSTLAAASFNQITAMSSYPVGYSRIYFTTSNGGTWDFSGIAGELTNFYDNVNGFARQTFTEHAVGSANRPNVWVRTSDNSTGWSSWQILSPQGVWTQWTPTWTTSTGSATPSFGNATIDCRYTKSGRLVTCKFDVTFGNTTNFGTSPGTGDNWRFTLPVAAARVGDSIGFLELNQSINTVVAGRAKTVTTTAFGISQISGTPNAVATNGNGDVDSVSPFTWATNNAVKGTLTYESAS